MSDNYGPDVLATDPHHRSPPGPIEVLIEPGLVVECADTGFCGAVIQVEKTSAGRAVLLEDRRGLRRLFPLHAGAFLHEGRVATLVVPRPSAGPKRSASGSVYVAGGAGTCCEGQSDLGRGHS
jgi:hypothetical protein